MPASVRDETLALLEAGLSVRETATRLGVHRNTVLRHQAVAEGRRPAVWKPPALPARSDVLDRAHAGLLEHAEQHAHDCDRFHCEVVALLTDVAASIRRIRAELAAEAA